MTNELTVKQQGFLVSSDNFETMQRMAKAMVASNYFSDVRDVAQAIVKIQAGSEIGIPPFAALTGIHIIKNKPVLGANLIATLIKNDSRYNYRVEQLDDDGCAIAFYENGEKVGESSFGRKDAQKAGLSGGNWTKYPRNMYFARAISNGAKWYTPGIFGGATIYTPDEMGVDEDESGNIIDVTPRSVDTDTGEITEGVVEELPATDDLPPSVSESNGTTDARAETSPQQQAERPRPSAPDGNGNGVKPFHKSIADEIGYFNAPQHVAHTMDALDINYPGSKAEAAAAKLVLEQYAGLRADGVEQDDAIKRVKGEAEPA